MRSADCWHSLCTYDPGHLVNDFKGLHTVYAHLVVGNVDLLRHGESNESSRVVDGCQQVKSLKSPADECFEQWEKS